MLNVIHDYRHATLHMQFKFPQEIYFSFPITTLCRMGKIFEGKR
jgi:hypothetical protein